MARFFTLKLMIGVFGTMIHGKMIGMRIRYAVTTPLTHTCTYIHILFRDLFIRVFLQVLFFVSVLYRHSQKTYLYVYHN